MPSYQTARLVLDSRCFVGFDRLTRAQNLSFDTRSAEPVDAASISQIFSTWFVDFFVLMYVNHSFVLFCSFMIFQILKSRIFIDLQLNLGCVNLNQL